MTTFPASAAPLPPATPRAPRRPLPLPARFVLGTALIGFPLAIGIGVLAAHASAPPPLETPAAAEATAAVPTPTPTGSTAPTDSTAPTESTALPENSADAAAKTDASAIGLGIMRFYQQSTQGGIAAPVVTVSGGTYILGPVTLTSGQWEWPPISMSEGVSLGGQTGTRQDDWCVWVVADGGMVKDWQVTNDGVSAGTCGLG